MTIPSGNPTAFPRGCAYGCALALLAWALCFGVVALIEAVWR